MATADGCRACVQYERSLMTDDAATIGSMLCTATEDDGSDQWRLMTVVDHQDGGGSDQWRLMTMVDHQDDSLLRRQYQFICQSTLTLASSPADDHAE